jgi:hypothetical protein
MRVTSATLSSLASDGPYMEKQTLWITGFPVYDQQASNFAVLSAGGAYQITFGNAIAAPVTNATFKIFSKKYTILSATHPNHLANSTSPVSGGSISIESSLTPITTVHVGHNLTGGAFTVQLSNLVQPTNGIAAADINIYYNGVLTNSTQIKPGATETFNISGNSYNVYVNSTFAGLYANQKWATIQILSNVYLVSGKQVSTNPGWNAELLWTNPSVGTATSLYGIILYNTTPTNLQPGQSFSFIGLGAKAPTLGFIGDTLASNQTDKVTITTSQSIESYQNLGANTTGALANITEPSALLTVTSQIPSAFSYSGQTGSSVTYILNPYKLVEHATSTSRANTLAVLTYNGTQLVSSTHPLSVAVTGYLNSSMIVETVVSFTSPTQTLSLGQSFYNISDIQIISRVLPGSLKINVESVNSNSVKSMATLSSIGPAVAYTRSGLTYDLLSQSAIGNVTYDQQNGQPATKFVLKESGQNLNYSMSELAVPNHTGMVDKLKLQIANFSLGSMTYVSTQGTAINVGAGFRTERGSKAVSLSPTTDTVSFATLVDGLQFTLK